MLLLFAAMSVGQYFRIPNGERLFGTILTALITKTVVVYLQKYPSERGYLVLADGVMLIYSILVIMPI